MKRISSFFYRLSTHSLFRGSAIVFAGSMIANVSAYVYHLVIGRILGPEKYGELAALFSIFYILNVPSTVVQTILVKFFAKLKAQDKLGEAKHLFLLASKAIFVTEIVLFLILLPFVGVIADFLHIPNTIYFFWLYLIFGTFLLGTVNGSILQAFQMFFESSLYTNFGMLLRLVFGILFAFWGVGWTLFANVLSNIITYIFSFFPVRFLLKKQTHTFSLSKKSIASYSIPTFLATLGITMLYSQDVVLVKHFFSPHDAGIYSSLSVLGRVIYFTSVSIGFVVFPVIAERKEQQRAVGSIMWLALGMVGIVSFGLTAIYFLFPSIVVSLLFGPEFNAAASYLGYFGLFISFFSLDSLLISISLAAEKTFVGVFAISAALGQIGLIYLFHKSLYIITLANLAVASSLFVVLLIYLVYEKRQV